MEPEISIILPCRNEEKAIGYCLDKIMEVIIGNNLNAEVIVSDSSTDKSPDIVREQGAKLVKHDNKGYGIAYLEGFNMAKGRYIVMADSDGTYEFADIPKFVNYLKNGYDFVIGNRFINGMDKKAMGLLHKIGNRFLSSILRKFYETKVGDSHCGIRAIRREALDKLKLQSRGMEFASEMVIKSAKKGLNIKEVPVNYYVRRGESKLHSFKDGWNHIKLMLIYSPLFLFLIPGIILFFLGIAFLILLYLGHVSFLGIQLQYHPMFFSSLVVILGYQLILFGIFAKTYAVNHLEEQSWTINMLNKYLPIERATLVGIFILILGLLMAMIVVVKWFNSGFKAMNEVKNLIIASTLFILGIQTFFSSFMLSILGVKEE